MKLESCEEDSPESTIYKKLQEYSGARKIKINENIHRLYLCTLMAFHFYKE